MFSLFFAEASPNAQLRNKQSTPTPCRYIGLPCREWIDDTHERIFDRFLS